VCVRVRGLAITFDFIPRPFYCSTDRGLMKTQIPNYHCLAPIGVARTVRLYEQEQGEPFRSPPCLVCIEVASLIDTE
jgi:hypothetical protein